MFIFLQMKKVFALSAAIFFLFLSSVFAKVEALPQEERPRQFVQLSYGRTMNRGINRSKNYGEIQHNFDWQPFGGLVGFQSDAALYDLTIRTCYLPFVGGHQNGAWRFGASSAYHMQRSIESFRSHDILLEIEARWISTNGLTFTGRSGYAFKATTFDAIKGLAIRNHDFVAYAEVDKVFSNGIELFTSIGTYNLYRYPLFFCPQWTFGAAYNFKKAFRLGALVEVGMTDFYASVAYFNHIMVKCNARICF